MRLLIKVGGTLVDDPALRASIAAQVATIEKAGHAVVIVHGGGRQLTRFLEERAITSRFVDGLRVTGEETIDAVLKVLTGSVNKHLVGALRASGVSAVGISGLDGGLTTAVQLSPELGWVGRITGFDASLLEILTKAGFVPTVACVAGDEQGQAWNINADQMATAMAEAFAVDRLIFLTDVPGVLGPGGAVLPFLDPPQVRNLVEDGVARGGMRAKLQAAVAALQNGVGSIVIAPGASDAVLPRLLAGESVGTVVRGD